MGQDAAAGPDAPSIAAIRSVPLPPDPHMAECTHLPGTSLWTFQPNLPAAAMTTSIHHLRALATLRRWRKECTEGDATEAFLLASVRQNMMETETKLTLELEEGIRSGEIRLESLLQVIQAITPSTE
jgi:hypothetical protein